MSVADDETGERAEDRAVESAAAEGDDVAGRDPDEITREIEQTRAELADTIDAIAQRISPKRVASRGAEAVKAQVTSAKTRLGGEPNAWALAAASEAGVTAAEPPAASSGPLDQVKTVARRPEIMAIAAAVVALAVFVRRRRSR